MKITNDIIESYFDCKLKSYLKRQGEQGEMSQIESHYSSKLQRYRARVYQKKFATSFTAEFTQIQSLLVFKNTDTIYNVRVTSKRFDFWFRETRIDDYLKIMSIYQSCKFQNISFLKYLLSTEDTLEAYVSKNRRHTNLD